MAFPRTTVDNLHPVRSAAPIRFLSRSPEQMGRHNPHVDAGWWPMSTNLAAEVADLLHAAQATGFRATRVGYCLDDPWAAPPGRVRFDGRQIRLSGYHNHHGGMLTLIDGISHERLEVLVVPPDTAPDVADRALRLAAEHTDPAAGAELLTLARGTQ